MSRRRNNDYHTALCLYNNLRSVFSVPFFKMIVPTVDTVRYSYITEALIGVQYPIMLVGPVGTGKTSVATGVYNKLDDKKYSILTVNMSAQVSIADICR